MQNSIAEYLSRLGLEDSYSTHLSKLLTDIAQPAKALTKARWIIPSQEELANLPSEDRTLALVPIVSIEVSRLNKILNLSDDFQAELVAEGFYCLSKLDFTFARNIKSYAWTAIKRALSRKLDALKTGQILWSDEGEPLNGVFVSKAEPNKPFKWDKIIPALRSLYDVCQDDTDRHIIEARWANGRCVTEGYLISEAEISKQLGIEDVHERLLCLRNRWRLYINRTQRFPKHLPAIPA